MSSFIAVPGFSRDLNQVNAFWISCCSKYHFFRVLRVLHQIVKAFQYCHFVPFFSRSVRQKLVFVSMFFQFLPDDCI